MSSPEQPPEEKKISEYLVEQYELHIATYRVISESAAGAIAKVLAGEAELPENSTEFVDVCEDFGMQVQDNEANKAIAKELEEAGVCMASDYIPSIRSVQTAQ